MEASTYYMAGTRQSDIEQGYVLDYTGEEVNNLLKQVDDKSIYPIANEERNGLISAEAFQSLKELEEQSPENISSITEEEINQILV